MVSFEINLPAFTLKQSIDPFATKARFVIGNLSDSLRKSSYCSFFLGLYQHECNNFAK